MYCPTAPLPHWLLRPSPTHPPPCCPPQGATKLAAGAADDLRLVEVGVQCSLEQMLEEGFYHADPHPGNLLRTPDGRLAYLDFGMMGSIERPIRQALIRATLHLVNRWGSGGLVDRWTDDRCCFQ